MRLNWEIGMTAFSAAFFRPSEKTLPPTGAGRAEILVAGMPFIALPGGALWHEADRVLVVADLHLEKGSSYARRGELLPPYDSGATLATLSTLVVSLDPAVVIALGDSFHDNGGAERLGAYDRSALSALQRGRDWIWIAGNHDDDLPAELAGTHASELRLGDVVFRHEPASGDAAIGEIAGHLHPAARVAGPRGSVRRKCFLGDGMRSILPAFGALAGGLNVLSAPFGPLFPVGFTAYVLGASAVYPVARNRLVGG